MQRLQPNQLFVCAFILPTPDFSPRTGVRLFWGPDAPADGHVALAITNNMAISTSERQWTPSHAMSVSDRTMTKPWLGGIIPG